MQMGVLPPDDDSRGGQLDDEEWEEGRRGRGYRGGGGCLAPVMGIALGMGAFILMLSTR